MTDAERIASKLNAVPAEIPGLWRVPVGPFNHPEMTTAQMLDYARREVLEGMNPPEMIADCRQPNSGAGCEDPSSYCLCRVYADALRRCIERGEGWRWGVGVKDRA